MPPRATRAAEDPKKQAFIHWLCTPPHDRFPSNMEDLAPTLGVHPKTLSNWKRDPDFREEWQKRSDEVIGDPDRVKEVMDTLFKVARDPKHRSHVTAAKLFLEAADAIRPKKGGPPEKGNKSATSLTDEELEELIALGAAELKASRGD